MAEPELPPALHRHVEPTRRRQLWWWALAGTAAANAALTLGLGARSSAGGGIAVAIKVEAAAPAPAPVVVVQAAPAPAPMSAPPAPVAEPVGHDPFADRGPCPAPHAGRPAGALTQPTELGYLRGIGTSPTDSRLVAAWDKESVHVSRDGGHTWGRVLDGEGWVLDVSFDCHGRVLALRRGSGLGMRDGMDEAWRPVREVELVFREGDDAEPPEPADDDYAPRLVGGGRWIAVLGAGDLDGEDGPRSMAAITRDAGATWRRVDLHYWERADVRGEWSGDTLRVIVPWTDCMSEGLSLVTVSPGGVSTAELGGYAGQVALAGATVLAPPSTCHYAEGVGDDVAGGGLCVWRAGRWTLKPAPADPDARGEDRNFDVVDGPVDVMWSGDLVYRVSARGYGAGKRWDARWRPITTDRAGRVWGLDELGVIVRA